MSGTPTPAPPPNSTATGGPLQPLDLGVGEDQAMNLIFQSILVGMTGIVGSLVRSRWQIQPAQAPDPEIDWISYGITQDEATEFMALQQVSATTATLTRWSQLQLSITCYGPDSQNYAALVRDGMNIPPNTYPLAPLNIRFVSASQPVVISAELTNSRYIKRSDLVLRFNRMTVRTYNILSFLGAQITIDTPQGPVSYTASTPGIPST